MVRVRVRPRSADEARAGSAVARAARMMPPDQYSRVQYSVV